MKKFVVSLALLGLFSVGTMAFIGHDGDEPPARQTEQRRGHCGWHDDCDGHLRHHRRGGCCGDYRTVVRWTDATSVASCARSVPNGATTTGATMFISVSKRKELSRR